MINHACGKANEIADAPLNNIVSRKITGKETPANRLWSMFSNHVIGSVD
nr:hypothetical protein [Candidatus Sigynarchaeum springense]